MRPGLALTLTVASAVGCGGTGHPELLDMPEAAPASFVNYRPDRTGCIFGDCVSGAYAKRINDRVIYGVVEQSTTTHIDWERGACTGWSYTGQVVDDLPHGIGILVPADTAIYKTLASHFEHGAMTGEADAEVVLATGATTHLRGELVLDGTCTVRFRDPTAITLDDVDVDPGATPFHGVVRILDGQLQPWRGSIGIDGAPTYVKQVGLRWLPGTRAVCLAGTCLDGAGVEHFGAGQFELFVGAFKDGLRHEQGEVYTLSPGHVGDYTVIYDDVGQPRQVRSQHARYGITADYLHGKILAGQQVQGLTLTGEVGVEWSPDAGLYDVYQGALADDLALRAKLPAVADKVVAAVAMMLDELPHSTQHNVLQLTVGTGSTWVQATVDGPRTTAIELVSNDLEDVNTLVQAWLPGPRLLVVGKYMSALANGRLHGSGDVIDATGTSHPAIFYDGVRIDPLGFKSMWHYDEASPKVRKARAVKAARAAQAIRNRDDRLVLALRNTTSDVLTALDLLATANANIANTAKDALGWERVIRSADAAVEQAGNATITALASATEALSRLAPTDPCFEPLDVLAADLRDLDDRLHVLHFAFDRFEYSDDAGRLAQIASVFAADLSALPTSPIPDHLATLKAAIAGAPQPTPDTIHAATPANTGATTPSPPP